MDRPHLLKIVRVIVYVALASLGPLAVFLLFPASVSYQITESYTFAGESAGAPIYLTVMLPRSGPYQHVQDLDVQWPGTVEQVQRDAVDVVRLEGTLPETRVQEAVLAYKVVLRQGRASWKGPIKALDLAPQEEIESDAEALVAQAVQIAEAQSREDAYRVYAFTSRHLSWPKGSRIGGNASALAAYETRIGVCGEFANLMTALSRAAGIPARSISGLMLPFSLPYVTQKSTWMHPGGAHAWAEVYTGEKWEMADASWASRLPWDRFWFGRTLGMHLSYGEMGAHSRIFAEMTAWAGERGKEIGAMSAPLRFAAAAGAEDVTVQPVVQVRKSRDSRWFRAAGVYVVVLIGGSLLERHWKKQNKG